MILMRHWHHALSSSRRLDAFASAAGGNLTGNSPCIASWNITCIVRFGTYRAFGSSCSFRLLVMVYFAVHLRIPAAKSQIRQENLPFLTKTNDLNSKTISLLRKRMNRNDPAFTVVGTFGIPPVDSASFAAAGKSRRTFPCSGRMDIPFFCALHGEFTEMAALTRGSR